MRVHVNGVDLFFDVDGEELTPDGGSMREKPTLLLLHGGPGFDHSTFKPSFGVLTDQVQLVYLDHRGNGRSERGPTAAWNLDQWADDVRAFCEALGIERPIVMGQSFGGMVALAYATRHPDHPGKLVFSSTSARQQLPRMLERFLEVGGEGARAAAELFWTDPSPENLLTYTRDALSVYGREPTPPEFMTRVQWNLDVLFHFAPGEARTYDYLPGLAAVCCPTLVLGGSRDPVCPIEDQEDIAAALPAQHLRFERFEGCGHGVFRDDPERAFAVIREFIAASPG
ncbi:MAG: hypothetical protein CL910_03760 [Deltaproteobacteria bacterium]|nr:hypothetical protein [Deltaproteobacteria bacterium]